MKANMEDIPIAVVEFLTKIAFSKDCVITNDFDGIVQERRNSIANALGGLVQDRHYSIANALELRLSCTNPSIYLPVGIIQTYYTIRPTDWLSDWGKGWGFHSGAVNCYYGRGFIQIVMHSYDNVPLNLCNFCYYHKGVCPSAGNIDWLIMAWWCHMG